MTHEKQTALRFVVVAVALCAAAGVSGCGDSDEPAASSAVTQTTKPAAGAARPPVPQSLTAVESAAEDAIGQALSGDRAAAVRSAQALARSAAGPAGDALRAGGVPDADVALFQRRAAEVARLAPKAPLLDVAIASNRAFGMVPGFLARFDSDVPAGVTQLDYFDFEAKLRARAADAARFAEVVSLLASGWQQVRPQVIEAGGGSAAAKYAKHVQAMKRLAETGSADARVDEAQRGLDLVAELEAVYG